MTRPEQSNPDAAILNQIRELTRGIRDQRTQVIVRSVIDAVALNPQPLPPRAHESCRPSSMHSTHSRCRPNRPRRTGEADGSENLPVDATGAIRRSKPHGLFRGGIAPAFTSGAPARPMATKKAPAVGGRPGLRIRRLDAGGCPDTLILPKDG